MRVYVRGVSWSTTFQFPSNGKVFQNYGLDSSTVKNILEFQFPSNGKVFQNYSEVFCVAFTDCCFNSLQTGRSFRTMGLIQAQSRIYWSFNSLQTGRSFRTTAKYSVSLSQIAVSIPFKREGLSEPTYGWILSKQTSFGFNSLQTGRTFRTAPLANPVTAWAKLAETKRDEF